MGTEAGVVLTYILGALPLLGLLLWWWNELWYVVPLKFRLVGKGYIIPKNWKVILWVRYLHTNSENFADPMRFNPDRWNEPAKPGTYQVFGGGPRICAGNMLARIQLALFLHHLCIRYKWELLNPDAAMIYLSHPTPVDGVEVAISKI